MTLIHLSDLHIGIRVNDFSMLEDQEFILTRIINVVDDEKPDAVLIAGDIYDKSMPSAEAVRLFDDFLVRLSGRGLKVFVVSGNHDSPERIAFGGRLMSLSGVHMSPVYDGSVRPVGMTDEYGAVDVYMLPYLKPSNVKRYYPEKDPADYTEALRTVIAHMEIDPARRNVLVTHQFVTGAARCESEEIPPGGSDNVDASVFAPFDYVALGHLHSPQHAGAARTVRYCGTPLKYSFSEVKQEKSVTVVEMKEKGAVDVRKVPLVPRRDMAEIRGSYMELTARSFYSGMDSAAYLHVTLTDEEDIPDAIGKLRVIYPNIMKLDYDNRRTRSGAVITGAEDVERKTPAELFAEFYEKQNNRPVSEEQHAYVAGLIEKVWEGAR